MEKGAIAYLGDYKETIKAFVYNGGKEIIAFNKGDIFAKIWMTPVYPFLPEIVLEN